MKKLTVCFSLLLIILAYATYNFINILDLFKTVDPTLLQEDNCQIIPGYIGIEDFVEYSDEILIGGSNNNLKLFTLNNYNDTENGNMISFNISSKQFDSIAASIEYAINGTYIPQSKSFTLPMKWMHCPENR